jgi:hypothetical protein
MINWKKYFRGIVVTVILLFVMIIAFNRLVDPYSIYGWPVITGINEKKPVLGTHVRMAKAAAIRHKKNTSIVLGSSRVEYGIDPDHPAWNSQAYNLGLAGANLYESLRYLQHAQAAQPLLNEVLLMLDFTMFDAISNKNSPDFTEERLLVDINGQRTEGVWGGDALVTLASLDATKSSIVTIFSQNIEEDVSYLSNGMRNNTNLDKKIKKKGGYKKVFINAEKKRSKKFSEFSFASLDLDNWDIYQKILYFSFKNDIKLHIAISPSHSNLYEIISIKDKWSSFEEWKIGLVTLNEKVALDYKKKPFNVWDFSGYNKFTTEKVIDENDVKGSMAWHLDIVHYNKKLGDFLLNKVLNYKSPINSNDGDFGVVINTNNIDQHLYKIRSDQKLWRRNNVAIFNDMVKRLDEK